MRVKADPESVRLFVYALCEPDGRAIRYVGLTSNLWTRLRSHFRKCQSPNVRDWLRGLRERGLIPSMIVLREVRGLKAGLAAESEEIRRQHGIIGDQLLNENEISNRRGSGIDWSRKLTYDGKTMGVAAWARELGMTRQGLCQRLIHYPPEVALSVGKIKAIRNRPLGEVDNRDQIDESDCILIADCDESRPRMSHAERRARATEMVNMVRGGESPENVAAHYGVTLGLVQLRVRQFYSRRKRSSK